MKNYFKRDDKGSRYFDDPKTVVSSGIPDRKSVVNHDREYKKSTNKVIIKRYAVKQN